MHIIYICRHACIKHVEDNLLHISSKNIQSFFNNVKTKLTVDSWIRLWPPFFYSNFPVNITNKQVLKTSANFAQGMNKKLGIQIAADVHQYFNRELVQSQRFVWALNVFSLSVCDVNTILNRNGVWRWILVCLFIPTVGFIWPLFHLVSKEIHKIINTEDQHWR